MPTSTLYAFILSFIAGISTLFGTIIIYSKKNANKIISRALSFSSGVMISISIIDLIPSSYDLLSKYNTTFIALILVMIYIIIGIILSYLIDKYLPDNPNNKSKLYRVGLISMIAIIMHNIPEGIATFLTTTNNPKLGLSLCIAIALHNIPEGISISVPVYYATNNKSKAILYTFISGFSEIIGSVFAYLFLKNNISNTLMSFLYAIIAGIMLHISFYELLPKAKMYDTKKSSVICYFIIGIIVIYMTHLFLN